MTGTSKLAAEAAAISDKLPAIKTFATDAAANLVNLAGRVAALEQATPTPTPTPTGTRWFADSSPWNVGTAGRTLRADSAVVVAAITAKVTVCNVNQGDWTPLVYTATAQTPRVKMFNPNGSWWFDNVPDPSAVGVGALPGDGWLAIVDTDGRLVYNLVFPSKQTDGTWHFAAAGLFHLDGSGCWDNAPGPWSGRAGGSCLLAGLLTPADVSAGVVNHALALALPKDVNAAGAHVNPCTTSDGTGTSVPMGSWLQLDPAVNVATLGVEAGEEMIYRALQTYGAFVVDSTSPGSSLAALYCVNTHSPGTFNYPASWSNGLSKWSAVSPHLRVLAPPSTVYDSAASMGQPHH